MWLPEAHAEASTAGSVILSGLILKIGSYGIVRYILTLFGTFTLLNPYIQTSALVSILIVSYSCFRVTHLKQIIAYTSIFHMNIILVSLFSEQTLTIAGSIVSMYSHSLISSALFICAGLIYSRTGTYELQYLGGLSRTMPVFSVLFSLICFSSIGLPFTLSFIGEFIIITSFLPVNIFIFALLIIILSLHSLFFLWMLHRIIYGDIVAYPNAFTKTSINHITDLNIDEFFLVMTLVSPIVILGFIPNLVNYFLLWSL